MIERCLTRLIKILYKFISKIFYLLIFIFLNIIKKQLKIKDGNSMYENVKHYIKYLKIKTQPRVLAMHKDELQHLVES